MDKAADAIEHRLVVSLARAEDRIALVQNITRGMDQGSRVFCWQRPFEGLFMSVQAMLFGGYRCAMFPPPWRDWY
jgi:hypothetical protein